MLDEKTKKKLEKYTGAVSVDGDVTPTLRKPIDQVDASDWPNLSSSELWDQRTTLQQRLVYAHQSAHPEIAKQIQNGIDTIDAILRSKAPESDGNLI